MQSAPGAPRPSRLTKWWPIGFFIGAIVCFIIGGALVGKWTSHSYDHCSYSSSYYSSYYSSYSCSNTNMGEFYGAVAMFVIGGVLQLTAWILLIIFCVKRNRHSHHTVTYSYVAPQPTYSPAHQSAQFPHSPEMVNSSAPGTPPNETNATASAAKYCTQCGTTLSGRFCPQCGS
ncbi:hypothetical protein N7516_010525 [Penicillium verrucosum]|uniref:uncharacterized protein n=1 Tax=Penicillium verrucosum TaxID=60171 RepID=UPI00254586D0|nr:uncharacterized protein N7516_010525 [Penicillium verrucosum]KAJ5922822.1 hypothetical protein N7516_010525 [Penicillium verrucosum]